MIQMLTDTQKFNGFRVLFRVVEKFLKSFMFFFAKCEDRDTGKCMKNN